MANFQFKKSEKTRIGDIRDYKRLINNNQYSVFGVHDIILKQYTDEDDLIYVEHGYPHKIGDFYKDFVQGDPSDLSISTPETAQSDILSDIIENNRLKSRMGDWAYDQSIFGVVPLLSFLKNDKIIIQQVPADQYFPRGDDDIYFASYIRRADAVDDDPKNPRNFYLYIQHYFMENDTAKIERSAYTVNAQAQPADQIDLSKVTDEDEEEDLGIDMLPVAQIDNGNRFGGVGRSDLYQVFSNLDRINEIRSHVAIQILKNLDAILEVPEGVLDEDTGEPKKEVFDFLQRSSKDIPQARYVTNDNALIEEANTEVEGQLQTISSVTSIPLFEFTGSNQPERVESLKIKMSGAQRKSTSKRQKIEEALQKVVKAGMKLKGESDPASINIEFGSVLPEDELKKTNAETAKVTAGVSSRKSAIMRLEGLSEEKAEEELDKIREEEQIEGVNNPNNPPQI